MSRYHIEIHEDGTATLHGVAHGRMFVQSRRGDVLAVKEGGYKYWSSRFAPWSYSPAKFRVFRLVEPIAGRGEHHWAVELVDFPVRAAHASQEK